MTMNPLLVYPSALGQSLCPHCRPLKAPALPDPVLERDVLHLVHCAGRDGQRDPVQARHPRQHVGRAHASARQAARAQFGGGGPLLGGPDGRFTAPGPFEHLDRRGSVLPAEPKLLRYNKTGHSGGDGNDKTFTIRRNPSSYCNPNYHSEMIR